VKEQTDRMVLYMSISLSLILQWTMRKNTLHWWTTVSGHANMHRKHPTLASVTPLTITHPPHRRHPRRPTRIAPLQSHMQMRWPGRCSRTVTCAHRPAVVNLPVRLATIVGRARVKSRLTAGVLEEKTPHKLCHASARCSFLSCCTSH